MSFSGDGLDKLADYFSNSIVRIIHHIKKIRQWKTMDKHQYILGY